MACPQPETVLKCCRMSWSPSSIQKLEIFDRNDYGPESNDSGPYGALGPAAAWEIMYPRTPSALALADAFWLMAHSEHSGSPKLATDIRGLGLAGALLGELMVDGDIELGDEQYVFISRYAGRRRDEASAWAINEIARVRTAAPIANWVLHLRDPAQDHVVQRLVEADIVELERRLIGKRRPVPRSVNLAAAPRVRMLHQIQVRDIDPTTALLAALAVATGLDSVIERDTGRANLREELITTVRPYLSPPMAALANAVSAASTQATLSIRRY